MSELKQIPRIKTDQATFLQIVKSIESLVEEATIVLSQEGLIFRGMDPSHVALIDIRIPNTCFEIWEVDQDVKFGFRTDEFRQILSSLNKKDPVTIEIHDMELILTQKESRFKIRLIEVSATDTPLPKIPYDASIQFDGLDLTVQNFKNALKQISAVSDYVTLDSSETTVILSGKGDSGDVEINYDRDQFADLNVKQHSISTYSLEYLTPFMQSLTKDSSLRVEYSSQKPLRLESKINNLGTIHFYLAPRVEN